MFAVLEVGRVEDHPVQAGIQVGLHLLGGLGRRSVPFDRDSPPDRVTRLSRFSGTLAVLGAMWADSSTDTSEGESFSPL